MEDPKVLYEERRKRYFDTIALKKTDRVPITPFLFSFPLKYYGVKTRDAFEDHSLLDSAWLRFHEEFQPDVGENPYFLFGFFNIMGELDFTLLRWAGHGLPDDAAYQYQDREMMAPEHYDWFLFDPTDFMFRHMFPRVYGKLAPLANLPTIRPSYTFFTPFMWSALSAPDMREAGRAMIAAAEQSDKTMAEFQEYNRKLADLGFPLVIGSMVHAPMDIVGDYMRGIKGTLIDLRRRPEKVQAACEKILPIMLEQGTSGCRASGIPLCFIPLHILLDGFMSQAQFEKYYWPTLLELIRGLVAEKIHPYLFVEGVCDNRLPVMIRDVPPGWCVFHLENSDIFRAKKLARDKVCLRGNIPVSLLMKGTPDDVRAYCKRLIDEVAPGGGFMMDTGVDFADAKPENIKAVFEYTREHGVY